MAISPNVIGGRQNGAALALQSLQGSTNAQLAGWEQLNNSLKLLNTTTQNQKVLAENRRQFDVQNQSKVWAQAIKAANGSIGQAARNMGDDFVSELFQGYGLSYDTAVDAATNVGKIWTTADVWTQDTKNLYLSGSESVAIAINTRQQVEAEAAATDTVVKDLEENAGELVPKIARPVEATMPTGTEGFGTGIGEVEIIGSNMAWEKIWAEDEQYVRDTAAGKYDSGIGQAGIENRRAAIEFLNAKEAQRDAAKLGIQEGENMGDFLRRTAEQQKKTFVDGDATIVPAPNLHTPSTSAEGTSSSSSAAQNVPPGAIGEQMQRDIERGKEKALPEGESSALTPSFYRVASLGTDMLDHGSGGGSATVIGQSELALPKPPIEISPIQQAHWTETLLEWDEVVAAGTPGKEAEEVLEGIPDDTKLPLTFSNFLKVMQDEKTGSLGERLQVAFDHSNFTEGQITRRQKVANREIAKAWADARPDFSDAASRARIEKVEAALRGDKVEGAAALRSIFADSAGSDVFQTEEARRQFDLQASAEDIAQTLTEQYQGKLAAQNNEMFKMVFESQLEMILTAMKNAPTAEEYNKLLKASPTIRSAQDLITAFLSDFTGMPVTSEEVKTGGFGFWKKTLEIFSVNARSSFTGAIGIGVDTPTSTLKPEQDLIDAVTKRALEAQ